MRYSYLRNTRTEQNDEDSSFIEGLRVDSNTTFIENNFATLDSYLNILILPETVDFGALLSSAMEASIDGKTRAELPDSAFGIKSKRQYPLIDPSLVRNAIKYFKYCGKDNRDELAANIVDAIKKFKMRPVITPHNPIRKYLEEADINIGRDHDNISKDPETDKNKFNTNPVMEADVALSSTHTKSIKKSTEKRIVEYFVSGESIYREPFGEELLKTANAYTKTTSGALSNIVKAIEIYADYTKTCNRFIKAFKFTDTKFINGLSQSEYDDYSDVISEFKDDIDALNRDKDAMVKKSSSGAIVSINKECIDLYIKSIQASNKAISDVLDILLDGNSQRDLEPKSMHFSEIFISIAKAINEISDSITSSFR